MTHKQALVLRAKRALQIIKETSDDALWEDIVEDLERRADASLSVFTLEVHNELERARNAKR